MNFDDDAFNRTLFFPRAVQSYPPASSTDLFASVGEDSVHIRVHMNYGARCTVLFFHGNGEVVADYDDAGAQFAAAGASLAVADYRGYGSSTGTPTLRNIMLDAHDVLRATLGIVQGPVVVMGRSIGSACANELYGSAVHKRVVGFVLESGFTSIPRLAERRDMKAPAAVDALFDPIVKLKRGKRPLLILHGAHDTLIRPDEAQAAFDAARTEDKELVLLEGRGHNDIAVAPLYWEKLAAFIRHVT